MNQYWLPTTPYTAIDAVNRAALSTGSVRYAQIGAHADYNGHCYTVYQSVPDQQAGTYSVSYMWSGPQFLTRRVSFAEALALALAAGRKGRGGSVICSPSNEADEAACRAAGLVPYEGAKTTFDHIAATMPWQCGGTWERYTSTGYAHEAVRFEREHGVPVTLFLEATSYKDWTDAVVRYREEIQTRRVSA